MNTRKDINRETFLFLWALAVCWWWMCSEKLGNFSHELFLQTTNMEVVGITGCIWFIYRSNSSLFNQSAISSYSRRRFTRSIFLQGLAVACHFSPSPSQLRAATGHVTRMSLSWSSALRRFTSRCLSIPSWVWILLAFPGIVRKRLLLVNYVSFTQPKPIGIIG